MGDVGGSLGMQRALVPVAERSRPAALYRIPVTLMLLGLFTMALQAGQTCPTEQPGFIDACTQLNGGVAPPA